MRRWEVRCEAVGAEGEVVGAVEEGWRRDVRRGREARRRKPAVEETGSAVLAQLLQCGAVL